MKRAVISFAAARTLNAAISLLQSTEFSFQLGAGVSIAPGQWLDPVNDLVEQFSTLMLAASVAFGVEKILISIGSGWLISLALTSAALGWAWYYFRRKQPPAYLSKMLVIILMVRFAIPVITIGSDMLFNNFLASDYESSQKIIGATRDQLSEIFPSVHSASAAPSTPSDSANKGRLFILPPWLGGGAKPTTPEVDTGSKEESILNPTAWKEKIKAARIATENVAEHVIKLMVVFLLQTLVLPLLLLWGIYGIARSVFKFPQMRSEVNQ
ncbi:MAG: hypothetical protein HY016_00060 [Nitrosomonadales bacterium]|nr:hypothetical protein [Nitrosomonadales bacterium]